MSAERLDPDMSDDRAGKVPMSDGEWVYPDEVLHYGAEDDESESDEARHHRLAIGAFSAAGLGLAIFGGIKAYKHIKDK